MQCPRSSLPLRLTLTTRSVGLLHYIHRETSTSLHPTNSRRRPRRIAGKSFFHFSQERFQLILVVGEPFAASRSLSLLPRPNPLLPSTPFESLRRTLRFPIDPHVLCGNSTSPRSTRTMGFPLEFRGRFERVMCCGSVMDHEG